MPFRVACGQFAPFKAEVDRNLDTIVSIILQAQDEHVDLLTLPETSTSGYFLEGGVLESSLTANALVEKLTDLLAGRIHRTLDVVLGFYQNEGGNLYNSVAHLEVAQEGVRAMGVYRKFFLPTYGVFDEDRFVSRGRNLCISPSKVGRLGLLVCEDVWHSIMPTLCAVNGAQVLIVPAASPARGFSGSDIDNHDRYKRLLRAISEEHGMFCVNCQLCGFEGGKGFIGGSMVVDPMGRVIAEAPVGEEHLLITEIDLDLITIARAQSPLISDLQGAWEEVRRMVAMSNF
jgi:predicted amidohydrolase